MEADLIALARQAAKLHNLTLEVTEAGRSPPAPMAERLMGAIEMAADGLGPSHQRLTSQAAHDAQSISSVVPSAMLFVPSAGGISHNPREFTRSEHVVNGANVLLRSLLHLAGASE